MKRFVCFLLTLVLIVSLVPATVLTANAASVLNTSDKAIEILKQFEGFSSMPYKHGTEWYIGYGTAITDPSIYPQGITKSKATELLKDHIEETVDKAINNFAKTHNLAFSQNQHDALALFSYNCGTGWMSADGVFRNAVRTGKKGNEFLYAIGLWSGGSPGSEFFPGLMNRRLAEANMYLNNSYSFYKPANYTYVVLDYAGGSYSDAFGNVNPSVFAYDSSSAPAMSILPTKSGSTFVGWYLDKTPVYTLDSTTAAKTLTAKWQDSSDGTSAKYDINSSEAASLNVYKTHSYAAEAKGTLRANSKFSVTKEFVDANNVKWVYGKGTGSDGKAITGWVGLTDLDESDNSGDKILATGTVIANPLNVREASTTASALLGTLSKGTVVNILAYKNEYTAAGTASWGKIMYNGKAAWINLAYVDLKNTTTEDNASLYGKTGSIVNAEKVNIRVAAGVGSALVTTLPAGTKVTVYETTLVNGATWGRIKWDGVKEGWVYMFYVQVDGVSVPGGTTGEGAGSGVAIYTGIVNSNTNLNVRKEATVLSAQLGSLPRGTKINIYEKKTTNGVEWGRTDKGWVCLLYVTLTATGAGGNGSGNGNHVLVTDVGTITSATLSLRKAPTNNSEQLALLNQGDSVTILEQTTETTTTGSKLWGKVTVNGVTGWINLAYVDIKENTTLIPDSDATGSTGATGTGTITGCTNVNVRAAAGVGNALVTTLPAGSKVTVYEQVEVNNAPWAKIDQGWVCMYYVTLNGDNTTGGTTGGNTTGGTTEVPGATAPGVISATGIVNSNTDLKVRSGPGLGYAQVGSLKKGTSVTVYEQKIADGMVWGKINSGWICMSYVTINSTNNSGTGVMGTVARCFNAVNVRSAPGTGNALVGTIQVGARVEVFEQRLYNGQYWGRVAQGWVCMQYILLDGELPPTEGTTTPSTPSTPDVEEDETVNTNPAVSYTFFGAVNKTCNIHKDATDKSDIAGTINSATSITVEALKVNGSEIWGKINEYGTPGWINLANVNFNIKGYAQYANVTVYSIPSTSGEGIGILNLNDDVEVYGLMLNGTTVWGKLDIDAVNGVVGWVQMSKLSYTPVALNQTDYIAGTTEAKSNSAITVYTTVVADTELCKLAAGSKMYITNITCDHGIVWGRVIVNGTEGYIDMSKAIFVKAATVNVDTLNVRNVPASNPGTEVLGTVSNGTNLTITSFMCATDGTLWGQIQTSDELNGGWVDMQHCIY